MKKLHFGEKNGGEIMSKAQKDYLPWKECKLGDVVEIVPGFAFKSQHFSKNAGHAKVIKITDIVPPFIDIDNAMSVDLGSYDKKKLEKYIIKKGDFIVAMTGATIGKIGRMRTEEIAYINQRVATFRPRINTISDFVYCSISRSEFQAFIQNNIDSNSAQENISGTSIGRFPILLPPLPEQRAIAGVLSSLDDKIDLLHRQNKTLEAMAETLFRQWFVEPCKNGLPEGWREGKISDLCSTITKGTTPTTLGHAFVESGVNFIKVESITDTGDFIWNKFAKISFETHEFLSRSIINAGDVLCSIAGTIGRLAIATDDILPANTNQAIAIIRADMEKCYPEFLYLFFKSQLFREIMDGKIVHAVQPNLSLGEIGNTDVLIPPLTYLSEFKKILQPLFLKKKENYLQIRTLENLRETLLPKLMSGEVRCVELTETGVEV